ncbi:hypothetical protein MKEN_00728100 [Mycena kentingensis (nom. inval.)]|nr:hypothetical protein MKEN_00728100 [Mycena kentingensis (nom. inval.)]
MPQWHNQFRAWLTIDGTEAEEYLVHTSQQEKSVSCWVASELGKRFSVHWENISYQGTTKGKVLVDGRSGGGRYICEGSRQSVESAGRTDGFSLRPYVFQELASTDDDTRLDLADTNTNDLGLIQLIIYPVAIGGEHPGKELKPLPQGPIHERDSKGLTQRIQLGECEALKKPAKMSTVTRTGPDIVRFCFRYRPIDVLRANGIAQPVFSSPSPTPSRPFTTSPEPDIKQDRDAYEDECTAVRLREQLKAVEARISSRQIDAKPRVKPDPDCRPAKKVKRESGWARPEPEIIALT